MLKRKNKNIIGSFVLIVISICMIGYKQVKIKINNNLEQEKIDEFFELQQEYVNKSTDESFLITEEKTFIKTSNNDYIAVIEIPKIGLKKGLYSIESLNNNVNKNIEILKESNMPNIEKGNFILAAHAGTGVHSYFKNVHRLVYDDQIYIYYNGCKYIYKLVNNYEINKTGEATVYRNGEKKTLTLITCKHNTDKQVVFIFELIKDGELCG